MSKEVTIREQVQSKAQRVLDDIAKERMPRTRVLREGCGALLDAATPARQIRVQAGRQTAFPFTGTGAAMSSSRAPLPLTAADVGKRQYRLAIRRTE